MERLESIRRTVGGVEVELVYRTEGPAKDPGPQFQPRTMAHIH